MALSPLLFNEKLTLLKTAGFIAVLMGVFLINGNVSVQLNKLGILCGLMSAVMFSSLLLNEQLTTLQIIGAILIIGGAIYGEFKKINNI